MGELLRMLKERGTSIADVTLAPSALAGLIALIDKGTINSSTGKDVFAKMFDSGRSAAEIVQAEGLAQIANESELLEIVRDVIGRNKDAVTQYRAGKNQTFGFLVGQVMKGSKGKANPKIANDLLKRELDSHRIVGIAGSGIGDPAALQVGPTAISEIPDPDADTDNPPHNLPLTPGAQAA